MNHSCSSIAHLLEKYFDRQATEEERSLVEKHLLACSLCDQRLRELEGLKQMIRGPVDQALQQETFPWVWEKIEKRLQQEGNVPRWETLRSWLGRSFWPRKKVWIPALAMALVLALIVSPLFFKKTPSLLERSVVEYVESQVYNVMVYESGKVTVIWLFETEQNGSPPS